MWDLPGVTSEPGEPIAKTAMRELYEETGESESRDSTHRSTESNPTPSPASSHGHSRRVHPGHVTQTRIDARPHTPAPTPPVRVISFELNCRFGNGSSMSR
ncbi:NUDIX domain-containing protein [Streptomyces caniferus]|uniref:NUDIX domain-containing protein n=1 Tax=Streptomyces caniferus TaxID=285557 RepID=UPI003F51889E